MYLETNLKIFRIDDGEEHFIVAENKIDAKEWFLKEMNFSDIQESEVEIREIQKDEDIQVNLNSDSDLLIELINRYRNISNKVESINIWDLLKYNLIADKLQDKEIEIPYIVCSSTFD